KQFVPMSVMAAIPDVLLVHPSVPANSVEELIAYAKANPGKLNYASQGNGTTSHLTAELFKQRAGGLQIAHIPYKGTAPALTDLLAGQVDMMCDNLGVSLPHVRSGKLKALAVASKKRFPGLPDVPALVGSREVLTMHAAPCGIALDDLYIRDVPHARPQLGKVAPEHGRAALEAAAVAIEGALAGKYDAVVGAPHTEAAIHAAGIKFDGYPSFVARRCGLAADEAMLMLCIAHAGREFRIAHVTLHTSVKDALAQITGPRIIRTLRATEAALRALGIQKPRIALAGVNPHAGEAGAFGREEIEVIAPAIAEAKRAGMAVEGP